MRRPELQEFFQPGGSLGKDHPSYIERQADGVLFNALRQGDCTCILNARQMGKTSLKNAARERLAAHHIVLVSADLALIGGQLSPDQWYCSLLQELSRGLEYLGGVSPKSLRQFWGENQHWVPPYRFIRGISELLLPMASDVNRARPASANVASENGEGGPDQSPVRLILAIDEIDKVRDFDGHWSDDFFGAVRGFYEGRARDAAHRAVGFLLIGVAPPSELIKNPNSTPFNIGDRIVLTDFTRDEARRLEQGFVLQGEPPARAARLLDAVLTWTGGHPYLTQRLCYQVALRLKSGSKSGSLWHHRTPRQLVKAACRECFLDQGIGSNSSDDNLRDVHLQLTKRLENDRYVASHLAGTGADSAVLAQRDDRAREKRKAAVIHLYAQVRRGQNVRDDFRSNPWIAYLHLSGIVRSDRGRLRVRNRVYGEIFDRRWIQENTPGTFRRAEQAAFFRGLATATCILVLLALAGWRVYRQSRVTQADHDLADARATLEHSDRLATAMSLLRRAFRYHPDRQAVTETLLDALSTDGLTPSGAESRPPEILALWDDRLGIAARLAPPGTSPSWLEVSPVANCVAVMSREGSSHRLTVHNLQTQIDVVSHIPACYGAVAFDARGQHCGFLRTNGVVEVLPIHDPSLGRTNFLGFPANSNAPYRIRFNPKKPWVALTSPTRAGVVLWDLGENSPFGQVTLTPEKAMVVRDFAWNSEGDQLAVLGEGSRRVVLWDVPSDPRRRLERTLLAPVRELYSISFLPDDSTFASVAPEQTLLVWKPSGKSEIPVKGLNSECRIVVSDGGWVSAVGTNLLQIWQFRPAQIHRSIPLSLTAQTSVAGFDLDPTGRLLLVATGSALTLLDPFQGRRLERLSLQGKTLINDASFSPPDGDLLVVRQDAVLRWRRQVRVTPSGLDYVFQPQNPLVRPRGMTSASLAPNGQFFALAHASRGAQEPHVDWIKTDHSGRLPSPAHWEQWIGQKLETNLPQPINRLSFTSNGALLLGYSVPSARLMAWSLQPMRSQPVWERAAAAFGASPDTAWLVTSEDATNRWWSTAGGAVREVMAFSRPFPVLPGVSLAVAKIAADEYLLAQATTASRIQLWRVLPSKDARPLATIPVPGKAVLQGLRITPDASLLACLAEHDGNLVVHLWDLAEMNRVLESEWGGGLFKNNGDTNAAWPVHVSLDSSDLDQREVDRSKSFALEDLEVKLRQLAASNPGQPRTSAQPNEQTKAILESLILTAEKDLRQSDWEAYFRAWADSGAR